MRPIPVYDWAALPEGFALRRDGVPLKTPAGNLFAVPAKALAEIMVEEWRVQGDRPKPDSMPFTQLAATAIDIVDAKRDEIIVSLIAHAASDVLCHRADAPPELAARQARVWQVWLDWAQRRYGASLRVGQGVMPVDQPAAALAALRDIVGTFDNFRLAGLRQAAGAAGSLILGLALMQAEAKAGEVFEAAELDSLFQIEKWGFDPVTTERHASIRRELEVCERWFIAISGNL